MMKFVIEALIGLVEQGSYPLVFILMTMESALIPVPSEVVMPFSGFLVSRGSMDFWIAVLSGVLGNLTGSLIAYYIGVRAGWEWLLRIKVISKVISESEIRKAENLLRRRGSEAVLIGRMMPGVRTVISLPAGMSRVDLSRFVLFTITGSIPWNALLVYSGMILEDNWGLVSSYLDQVFVAILVIAFVYIVVKRIKNHIRFL
ncbi:MAG: DedA family protein [Thermoproteota archaeon]|jgi:membrane protein DedA with SNARE-associated domain|uniref:DedA family protein n=1 Tax=Candidatus Methanodesulfokora washburnensis TaxID=2478471 RepID=A0A429GJG9_9CREN|nr:DedA family protein [Candidatus Methanodesulfokores washburnensis]RSN73809.1 DedA family protein [Candidatus Methanodesulfokores washburnensis]RZN62714.1 MAG: DedA family protein [Candidatus Methanodesulfokores washburnensis]TDA38218.1 MAG: DedA family protein [Candidatus Korarchaeota archaeon]